MEQNNKNYVNLSWLIYLVMGIIGFFVVRFLFDELNLSTVYDLDISIYIFDVFIIIYGFISCGLVYNLGKMIFSLICGYKLVYFNFYFFGIEKNGDKNRFYIGTKYDLNCKVVMEPKKDDVKTTLPLLGGTIFTIIALVLTYVLIFALKTAATTKFFFLVSSLFYFFMVLLNMVPCRMDSLNDGFTLLLLKDKTKKQIYLNNLKNIGALFDSNKEIVYQDIEIENHPLSLEAQIYNYYYLLVNGEEEKAIELLAKCEQYKKNLILEEHHNLVFISKVFNMCLNKENEEIKKLYNSVDINYKHLLNESKKLESIKTALYIFTYIDEDKEGYIKTINDIEKNKKKYKYPRFVEFEEQMIKKVLKDVQDNKPEWNE